MLKTMFRVPGMHCSACVMQLEGIEDQLPGVRRVNASYRKQLMEVEYDEQRVTIEQISGAAHEIGYEAVPLP